jgi:hypothetical protein
MAPTSALAALAALTLACLAALPGAGPANADPAGGGAGPGDGAGASGFWAVDGVEPIGQPVAVGAAIVGYTRRDQRVYLQARDPASGDLLWEAEAVEDRPVRAGEWLVYRESQADFGDGYESLVVADPLTGTQSQRSPAMVMSGSPQSCHGGRAVCVSAAPEAGEPPHGYRLDLGSGAFIPAGAGVAGEGLIRIGTEIALVRDGVVLWRRPDPGVTQWAESPVGGVWTGATATGSLGLSASGGSVLWTRPGTLADCGFPLRDNAVRCRDGRIEGFDPMTGKAHWSVPLRGPVGVGAAAIVVRGVAIALPTGERSPATGAYWCMTGGLASICGAAKDGESEVNPPVEAWTAVGAVAGDHVVVATVGGYLGRPVRP